MFYISTFQYKFRTFFLTNPMCSVKPHTSKKTRGHSWLEAGIFHAAPLQLHAPHLSERSPWEGCPMQKQPLLRGAKPTGDVCGRAAICAISSRLQSPPWGDGGLVGAQPPLAIITARPCPRALGHGAMGSGTATQERGGEMGSGTGVAGGGGRGRKGNSLMMNRRGYGLVYVSNNGQL